MRSFTNEFKWIGWWWIQLFYSTLTEESNNMPDKNNNIETIFIYYIKQDPPITSFTKKSETKESTKLRMVTNKYPLVTKLEGNFS